MKKVVFDGFLGELMIRVILVLGWQGKIFASRFPSSNGSSKGRTDEFFREGSTLVRSKWRQYSKKTITGGHDNGRRPQAPI